MLVLLYSSNQHPSSERRLEITPSDGDVFPGRIRRRALSELWNPRQWRRLPWMAGAGPRVLRSHLFRNQLLSACPSFAHLVFLRSTHPSCLTLTRTDAAGDEWPRQHRGALFSADACALTRRLALMTQHAAFAASLPRLFFRPLMSGALRMRGFPALTGNLALLLGVHRRKPALLC